MKRIVKTILSLVIIVSLALPVFASSMQVNASDYISSYVASVQADGGGDVTINFQIVGTGCMDQIGATTIYLYEKNNGSTSLVATYSYTASQYADNMMGYNAYWKYGSVSYNGVSGREYYARVYFISSMDGGSDTRSYLTSTITA
ncbi:MAG: hypothetical protein EOM54_06735 [Clostridia bacterium]|nr:hypothetical protein [Clostridia bacterium]